MRYPWPMPTSEEIRRIRKRPVARPRPQFLALLRRPLPEILREAEDADKHVGALALEALAFRIMRLLDLDYVATRPRSAQTDGIEVGLVFEGKRLLPTRWQIQCNNAARLTVDDMAKEVGLTYLLKSNAIVVATTGKVGADVRRYANEIIRTSTLDIVILDGTDLKTIAAKPASISSIFDRESGRAARLKKLEAQSTEGRDQLPTWLEAGTSRRHDAVQEAPP